MVVASQILHEVSWLSQVLAKMSSSRNAAAVRPLAIAVATKVIFPFVDVVLAMSPTAKTFVTEDR